MSDADQRSPYPLLPDEDSALLAEAGNPNSAALPTQAEVLAWVAARWPEYVTPVWRAMKLGEESGEVLGAVLKASLGLKPRSEIAVESAQAVMCLLGLAEAEGFDLWAAVAAEWQDMSARIWPTP